MFAAMQLVEYEPIESLKGKLEQPTIIASHYVVANSLIADAKLHNFLPTSLSRAVRLWSF